MSSSCACSSTPGSFQASTLSDTDVWTGDNPKVSVVSSLYGNRATLAPFLNALRNQDYDGAIEVILVDDASPDGAGDAALALATQLTGNKFSVEVIRNTENLGNCGSRNRGIAAASGDYLVVIDPDSHREPPVHQDSCSQSSQRFRRRVGADGIESGTENAETLVNRLELLGPAGICAAHAAPGHIGAGQRRELRYAKLLDFAGDARSARPSAF